MAVYLYRNHSGIPVKSLWYVFRQCVRQNNNNGL